jgi:hypothetical protein
MTTPPKVRRRPGHPRSRPDALPSGSKSIKDDSKRSEPDITPEHMRAIDWAFAELSSHHAQGRLTPTKGDVISARVRAILCFGYLNGRDDVCDDEECKKVVVGDARAGNAEAVLAAKIIVDSCRKRNLPLPPSLSDLVAELFQQMADGEKLPVCKNPVVNGSRDIYIALAVHRVAAKFHPRYTPTRQPESRHEVKPSGSWIVSKALERLGIKLSQSTVEGIYSDRIPMLRIIAQTEKLKDLGFFS